jgi:cell division protein FtsL
MDNIKIRAYPLVLLVLLIAIVLCALSVNIH